jgi:hypothetical protein
MHSVLVEISTLISYSCCAVLTGVFTASFSYCSNLLKPVSFYTDYWKMESAYCCTLMFSVAVITE